MSDTFIAEITMFGGNFAPRNYAFCNGQLLSIAQNTALFSLVGTTYGGNGQTTFGLPDLRGRVAVGSEGGSAGPGLPPYQLGQMSGSETVTLQATQMPLHNHSVAPACGTTADSASPTGNVPATPASGTPYAVAGGATMAGGPLANAGGSQPHNNLMPYTVVNFIIALVGIFPSRN